MAKLAQRLAEKAVPCEREGLPLKCGDGLPNHESVTVPMCRSCAIRPATEAAIKEAIKTTLIAYGCCSGCLMTMTQCDYDQSQCCQDCKHEVVPGFLTGDGLKP